jgi:hypothetical protein
MWRQFLILKFDPHQKILNNIIYVSTILLSSFKKNYEETMIKRTKVYKCHKDKLVPFHFHISRALKSWLLSQLINWLVIYPVPRGKWCIKPMLIPSHSTVNSPPCPGGRSFNWLVHKISVKPHLQLKNTPHPWPILCIWTPSFFLEGNPWEIVLDQILCQHFMFLISRWNQFSGLITSIHW